MTLDPEARGSWRALLDLLRPPVGYKVGAAFGSTFSMSFDALVAGLLAMLNSEDEQLSTDPLAGLLAATRLGTRVRIFVDDSNMSARTNGLPARLALLLESIIVPVRMTPGVFHPKLWVIRFDPAENHASQTPIVRAVVGSRNLAPSNALEIGAHFEGICGKDGSPFGEDVAQALESCFDLAPGRSEAIAQLPKQLRKTTFELPPEGRESCRLRWQAPPRKAQASALPATIERALLLSPFLSSIFVDALLKRTNLLRVISTPTAFRTLPAGTFTALREQAVAQATPVMYVVKDDLGTEDAGRVEGLHAKVLLCDNGKSSGTATFLGSANATAAGWGLGGQGNVECIAELRPGLAMDRFMKEFLIGEKGQLKPWIAEFQPEDRVPLTEAEILQEDLQACVRELAAMRFTLQYDAHSQVLSVQLDANDVNRLAALKSGSFALTCIPLGAEEDMHASQSLDGLTDNPLRFSGVALSAVSAFLIVRATAESAPPASRIAMATLEMDEKTLRARDDAARKHLLSNVQPEQILRALVLGTAHSAQHGKRMLPTSGGQPKSALSQTLSDITLERMLQAVALNPDLVREMRLLLAGHPDEAFARFQLDLEAVAAPVEQAQI